MAIDYTPVEDAGLTKTEFAALMRVTRATVHRWRRGNCEPTPYLREAVQTLLGQLSTAVEEGYLPGPLSELEPSRYTMDERRAVIEDALTRVKKSA